MNRRPVLLPLLALLSAVPTFAVPPLLDQPMTARVTRTRSYATDVLSDGRGNTIVDAKFILNSGDNADFLTRFRPDGEVDLPFALNSRSLFPEGDVAPGVFAMATDAQGRILAALGGTTPDGVISASEIVRLQPDGNGDPTFSTRGLFGAGNVVFALQPLKDGRILAAGRVLTGPKNASAYVVRLNADGSLDGTYKSELRPLEVAGLAAYALEPAGNGRYLLGKAPWRFETVAEGNTEPRLSVIDSEGREVRGFGERAKLSIHDGVYAVRRQKDGRVLVGGIATLVRLRPNGDRDAFFDPPSLAPTAPQRPAVVRAIQVQNDGRILVGGDFEGPKGVVGFVRLLPDGQIDEAFMRNLGQGFQSGGSDHRGVTGIQILPDGGIVVAGYFETVNGVQRRGIARLKPNGTPDVFPLVSEVGLR